MAKPLPVIPAGKKVFQLTEMIASRHFQEFLGEIAGVCVPLGQTTHEQTRATIDALASAA